jgi:POT family proton-dependent oligopeptide transporter
MATVADGVGARNEAFGHPKGLWVLAGTELWDRISFHGMQAMLTLYMAGELLLPGRIERVAGFAGFRAAVEGVTGPLSAQALAVQTFGLYVGLVYFTPVIGGWIGDRLTGRRTAVAGGALLMTAGHFALAFDRTFLLALLLLILGAGLLRGNLSAQIKSLYADGDRREADAFQYYYLAVNMGAFIAPVVSGLLAAVYGWHTAFAFAGFGMLIGLVVYLVGQKHLPADPPRVAASARAPLTADERRRVGALLLYWPVALGFWTAQAQVWNVYNLWVRDHVDLQVGSFTVPVPWLQSLDGLAPAAFIPLVVWLWRRQAAAGTEPGLFTKLAIGCGLFAVGMVWLAMAPLVSGADGRAPLIWAVMFHVISNLGAVFYAGVELTLFATRAPESLRATMIGIRTLSVFAASILSGAMGSLYEGIGPSAFWLVNAAIVAMAGVVVLLGRRGWARMLGG